GSRKARDHRRSSGPGRSTSEASHATAPLKQLAVRRGDLGVGGRRVRRSWGIVEPILDPLNRADAGVELAIAFLQPLNRLLNDEQTVVELVQSRDRHAGIAFEAPHLRETFCLVLLRASPQLPAPRRGGSLAPRATLDP